MEPVGLVFLSMYKKVHHSTTNNKEENDFVYLETFPTTIESVILYVPRNLSAKFEQNPLMDSQDSMLTTKGQMYEIVFLQ